MKKYLSFFRLRFLMGLQYRAAAWAGIVTQFVWGGMEIAMFRAFYESEPERFPMTFQATVSYIWFQQAFLALFASWMLEPEIFESIRDGNIAYELCRPVKIYPMLFVRTMAVRISRSVLRCVPILAFAFLLPRPYGLSLPSDMSTLILFLVTMIMGLLVTAAWGTLIYVITFFTVSAQGLQLVSASVTDFFNGSVIPIPFFPGKMRIVMELLPFAAMQNVPLRIYSGDLCGVGALRALAMQIVWLTVLVILGQTIMAKAEKKLILQGG